MNDLCVFVDINIDCIFIYIHVEWPSWSTKESEMQYLDAISKTTE